MYSILNHKLLLVHNKDSNMTANDIENVERVGFNISSCDLHIFSIAFATKPARGHDERDVRARARE
jgi:hypothetical protein